MNGYDAIAGSGARLGLEELFIQVHTVKFDSKSAAQAAFKFYAKPRSNLPPSRKISSNFTRPPRWQRVAETTIT
nr:hypothetical protein [uncultured Campylobacter sp.]